MHDTDTLIRRHRLHVDAYHQMGAAGIFSPDDRVELLNGEVIDLAPIGPDHAAAVDALNEALVTACGAAASVSTQSSVRLDQFSEPEPDFSVSRRRADRYRTARPTPADILLLVEVSDSSLRYDRVVKLAAYARAGVPEYWIVDLRRRVVDVHRDPSGDFYATVTTHGPTDTITLAMAAISVSLDGVFG